MRDIIINGASKLGITVTESQCNALTEYYNILIDRNRYVNLTRITEPEDVAVKHFLDSMTALLTGKIQGSVIDVGTGAGFPGLVLKCVKPEIQLTLLDSLNKRINFLKDAASAMGISDGIDFIHSRAEEIGHNAIHREKYDAVVSRAVANMRTLSEWCLPLTKVGGYFLALKGPLADTELQDALPAIRALGGEPERILECPIPYTDLEHKIIIVKKIRSCKNIFPRKGKNLPPAETVRGKCK